MGIRPGKPTKIGAIALSHAAHKEGHAGLLRLDRVRRYQSARRNRC
jgi:hypothetical protein